MIRTFRNWLLCCALVALAVALSGSVARATTFQCCTSSSDFGEIEDPTDPAQLEALFDFVVTDPILGDDFFTLTLSVENQTPVSGIDASFNINALFFNAVLDVLSVTLVSVTDETAVPDDVTGAWGAEPSGPAGQEGAGHQLETAENIGGFDDFMYSLWGGTGIANPSAIQPGETSIFVFTIEASSGSTITMDSFDTGFINNQGNEVGGSPIGAKFVSCSGTDCVAPDDSSFGAGVPEPGATGLLSLGLAALAYASRRRR